MCKHVLAPMFITSCLRYKIGGYGMNVSYIVVSNMQNFVWIYYPSLAGVHERTVVWL